MKLTVTSFRANEKPSISLEELDEFLNLHSEGRSMNIFMTHNGLLSGARLFARPLELECAPDMGMSLWGGSPLWE